MKSIVRFIVYILGLFLNALGIVLSTYTNLGVACVTCFCTNFSNFLNITLGTAFSILYTFYVFLEFLLLKKEFSIKNFLQLFFAFILGFFTDFFKSIIFLKPTNFISQLLLLIVSLFLIGLSVVIIINCDLVPSAPDGFVQVLSMKMNKDFGKIKVIHDITIALLGILLGILSNKLEGLGIATVIAALSLGKIISFLEKFLKKPIQKICLLD